jgi:hypothetical protein
MNGAGGSKTKKKKANSKNPGAKRRPQSIARRFVMPHG